MGPYRANRRSENILLTLSPLKLGPLQLGIATLLAVFAAPLAAAQDINLHVTYVCNGEHIYIEGCNIRDLSDTSAAPNPCENNACGLMSIITCFGRPP